MSATRRLSTLLLLLPGMLLFAACTTTPDAASDCPQPRTTLLAPEAFYTQRNPVAAGAYDRERAHRIFETNDGAGCIACHGKQGDGRGLLAAKLSPAPRNFTCRATMDAIPDGQLFWVIRNGSPGTGMLSHPELSDEETWLVVRYIRELGR